ncbi:hypothetical protein Tco_0548392 [Tanacetum coccineum]
MGTVAKPMYDSNSQSGYSINENDFSLLQVVLLKRSWASNQWTFRAKYVHVMLEQNQLGVRLYVGNSWVGLEFDTMDQLKASRPQSVKREIFGVQRCFSDFNIADERCVLYRPCGSAIGIMAPEVIRKSLHRVIESFRVSYRNRTYRIIATEFAYWAPNIESMEVNSESNPLERKDAEGPSLDESLENEEHLDVDSCDSDSPKNVNNDSVSPSSRVLREEDVRGVESDHLWTPFEEG